MTNSIQTPEERLAERIRECVLDSSRRYRLQLIERLMALPDADWCMLTSKTEG